MADIAINLNNSSFRPTLRRLSSKVMARRGYDSTIRMIARDLFTWLAVVRSNGLAGGNALETSLRSVIPDFARPRADQAKAISCALHAPDHLARQLACNSPA